ncbi:MULTISPECIES: peptidoglycan recognition protein family protein [unclassified Dyella]|uniref:peptidoglycan recognition protein family protein n=1 Tax=unclassified Dyella TaxID=2634549 RepID=UPI003F923D42
MADYSIKHWTTATTAVGSGRDDAIEVTVNNRAAVRQAIIDAVQAQGVRVQTRSDWKAKTPATSPEQDWDYTQIAIHHAGNSFSCSADGAMEMRKVEATDLGRFGQVSYHYAIDCKGIIYEALDIRYKGSHIELGNTGAIGIVLLANLSLPGEAMDDGPSISRKYRDSGLKAAAVELAGVTKDALDFGYDVPTEPQIESVSVLCKSLASYFNIAVVGGHREFANKLGTSRACPGAYGLVISNMLRRQLNASAP